MRFLTGFKNLKIRQKLLVGFGVVIFLMLAIVAVSINSSSRVERDVVEITEFQVPSLVQLQQMKSAVLEGAGEAFAYTLLNEIVEKEEFFQKMEEFEGLASEFEIIAHLGTPGEEEESELFKKILSGHSLLVASAKIMFSDFEKSGTVNFQSVEVFEESIHTLITIIDQFRAIELREVNQASLDANKSIATATAIIYTTGLSVLIFVLLFSYFISRFISRPINKIRNAATHIAKGNMDIEINTFGKDEIADLARSIDAMRRNLNVSMEKVKNRSIELEKEIIERKGSEEKLQVAYEYLDTILLNLPTGVAILEGPEFRYFRINKVLADMNGLSVEKHLGKTVAEVLPEAAEHIIPFLNSVLKTGEPVLNREFSIRLPKDPKKDVHLIDFHYPITFGGRVKAIASVVVDITKRKETEEKIKLLKEYNENIVANIPSSILVFDKNLKCVSANRAFYYQWSKPPGSADGKSIYQIFPTDIVKKNKIDSRAIRVLKTKKTSRKRRVIMDDKVVDMKFVHVSRKKASAGAESADVILIVDDVTAEARLAIKLEKRADELEEKVNERTRDLSRLNKNLEQVNKVRSDFIDDASHELRTPLAIIKNNLDYALRKKSSKLANQTETLSIVNEEIKRISKIISDLALLSRADAKEREVERKKVRLDTIIKVAVEKTSVLGRDAGIAIQLRRLDKASVIGNKKDLENLIMNLLTNAIRYGKPEGTVRVRLAVKNSQAKVIVADDGIGIPSSDLPLIFDRFYRVDKARSRRSGGTGLGLAICKWIVETHNGKISVVSTLGKGSKFTVRLPISFQNNIES